MSPSKKKMRTGIAALIAVAALSIAGCANSNPIEPAPEPPVPADTSSTIVIGSQAYYSNEIIAEIYAQALEGAGYEVERKFNIGQREAYMPAIESGEIGLFPEYTGNLLQWFEPDTTARTSQEVYDQLGAALPEGLTVLNQAPATDQDSYNVTAAFAKAQNLQSLEDLAHVQETLTLGGAPELAERPYGPKGLKELYDVTVQFLGSGDTTVEELVAGTINIANVYSADPRIQTDELVTLADPKGLFLASHVVPLVNANIAVEIAEVINAVSAKLTPEGLVAMNVQSTVDQLAPDVIATQWLKAQGLG
ncbi:MAG: ABC transporter substrate-binding protein [Microthrixaceae bacterium]|nr:ABC transporter substrate-binding protein [Microthrixaceae bacterium]